MDTLARGYSQLGVEHLRSLVRWVVPEGHPLLRDALLFRWWHVALALVLYPLVIGNARAVRFDRHPEPMKLRGVSIWFTIASVFVYLFILFEIASHLAASGSIWSTCHRVPEVDSDFGVGSGSMFVVPSLFDGSENRNWLSWLALSTQESPPSVDSGSPSDETPAPPSPTDGKAGAPRAGKSKTKTGRGAKTGAGSKKPGSRAKNKPRKPKKPKKVAADSERLDETSPAGTAMTAESTSRLAFILWLFHISRASFDFFINLQNTLTKPLSELRTTKSLNEIRFSLTHFVMWWLILLYEPGGEVLFSIATVCLFYLGTIACAISPDRLIDLKMGLWVAIVLSHFARHAANLWSGCQFPAALLAVSPPFDINDNIHMLWFYRWGVYPLGFMLCYAMFARGASCTWTSVVTFLAFAQWNHSGNHGTLFMPGAPGKGPLPTEDVKSSAAEPGKPQEKVGQALLRKCAAVDCNTYETSLREFNVCQRCRSPYCSRLCQEKDWAGYHRLFCRILRKRKLSILSGKRGGELSRAKPPVEEEPMKE
jgi:hypothetical protein